MTFKASCLYAVRILKPKAQTSSNGRKSLFGSVFAVALSLIPLVMVFMIADGMIEGITGRIIGLSSYHVQVTQTQTQSMTNDEHILMLENLAKDIADIEGVTATFVEREGVALAVGKNGRTGATVRAVNENIFTDNAGFRNYVEVVAGVAAFENEKSAVIGKKIAETLELSVGDTLRLMTVTTLPNGTVVPKMLSAQVSGIISSGYEEIDALWVFLPFKTGFDYLSTASSYVKIGVETANPFSDELTPIAGDIAVLAPQGFRVYRWSDINSSQYENYASTKMLLMLIMLLILLVASVNISSALIMTVMERQSEIAILKSMGASSGGITVAFLITGLLCGIAGLIIGLPLGIIFGLHCNEIFYFIEIAVNEIAKIWYTVIGQGNYLPITLLNPAYYLQTIPVKIPTFELFLIFIGTIILSISVSVAPALRAGKEKPLDILRKI